MNKSKNQKIIRYLTPSVAEMPSAKKQQNYYAERAKLGLKQNDNDDRYETEQEPASKRHKILLSKATQTDISVPIDMLNEVISFNDNVYYAALLMIKHFFL